LKTVTLGKEGIESIIGDLDKITLVLINKHEITDALAQKGADLINANLPNVASIDGNDIGNVTVTTMVDFSRVSFVGSQVAYIEFGTGIVGLTLPYVATSVLNEVGWEYDVNGHGEEGWVYRKDDIEYHSIGMDSLAPVYKASMSLEDLLPNMVGDMLNEKFSR